MNRFKGTAGPWKPYYTRAMGDVSMKVHEIIVMPDRRRASQHISVSWDSRQVGRNGGLTFEEAEANAHLIAAAPDLLEALQNIMAAYEKDQHLLNVSIGMIRTAITKALGEEVTNG